MSLASLGWRKRIARSAYSWTSSFGMTFWLQNFEKKDYQRFQSARRSSGLHIHMEVVDNLRFCLGYQVLHGGYYNGAANLVPNRPTYRAHKITLMDRKQRSGGSERLPIQGLASNAN